jgi:hypothetical protein
VARPEIFVLDRVLFKSRQVKVLRNDQQRQGFSAGRIALAGQ